MKNIDWVRFWAIIVLSFAAMYALMYIMVDSYANAYNNLNQVYMAAVMVAAMATIGAVVTAVHKRKMRIAVACAGVAAVALFSFLVRSQAAISDAEFLRSMIPHHGAAVLMCEQAPLRDPEIRDLCEGIVSAQRAEIEWMKNKLEKMKAR